MSISFDIISDLNLSPDDEFNWEHKPTSLFCLLPGNISSDLKTIYQTLSHLSKFYQGVFYIMGSLEYQNVKNISDRTSELCSMCKILKKVGLLHHHVIVLDGIAIMGGNGWYGNTANLDKSLSSEIELARFEDIAYMKGTLEKLQTHMDVKKIVVLSSCVPNDQLFFGEKPIEIEKQIPLDMVLPYDTQKKISHWVYGNYDKNSTTMFLNNIQYISNGSFNSNVYWPKRIEVPLK